MKFDTIIIGGGLSGLTAAVSLAEKGVKVAVASAGRSALLFNSGSFGLLGFDDSHNEINDWKKSLSQLPTTHPYSRIGVDNIPAFAEEAVSLLSRCGLNFQTLPEGINHNRVSPLGIFRPAWLTLDNILSENSALENRHIAMIGIAGFLDFYPRFIAASLNGKGCQCDVFTVDTPDLKAVRSSESEMRAVNIGRVLHGFALKSFAEEIKKLNIPSDATIVIPAVVELSELDVLQELLQRPVLFAPTLGVSLPGMYIHSMLVRRLVELGGRILNGHRVVGAKFEKNKLVGVMSDKLDDDMLVADNYIFAAGSFFSHGLIAKPDSIVEPMLGLDVEAPADRSSWFASDLFGSQPVMKAGIATDDEFRAKRGGNVVTNVFAVGSTLSGADSVREESGAGIAMLTAMSVADTILKQN